MHAFDRSIRSSILPRHGFIQRVDVEDPRVGCSKRRNQRNLLRPQVHHPGCDPDGFQIDGAKLSHEEVNLSMRFLESRLQERDAFAWSLWFQKDTLHAVLSAVARGRQRSCECERMVNLAGLDTGWTKA